MPPVYSPIKGTSIKLVSLSGEIIQTLKNTDDSGSVLKCRVTELKNGGVDKIDFSIDRKTNIPTFPGMVVEVYKDTVLFATGYSTTIPKPGSENNTLKISCLGYQHRLKLKTVNKSYISKTLDFIIADIQADLLEVDIFYDVSLIDLPSIVVPEIDFNDKNLQYIITTVLQIANSDYNNAQYRYFIDKNRKLNYELIDQDPVRSIFEGFNYQNPKVNVDDGGMINRLLAYKSSPTVQNELVFVGSFEDTESQGQYGIREKKFVYPDITDDATLADMSNEILQRNKDPETLISIKDLEGIDFPFRFYKISNRLDNYWMLLSECDSFDNWDISGAVNSTVTLSEEQVLTGRRSIKCALTSGSLDEEIILTPPAPVFSPSLLRIYVYLEETFNFDIIAESLNGETVSFSLGSAELKMEADTLGGVKNIEGDIAAGVRNIGLTIQVSYINQWLKVEIPLTLRSIKDITIKFKTDATTIGYIDRIEALSKSYNTNILTLEKIKYILDKDFALSDVEFGETLTTLHDAIKEKVEPGQVSLALATKQ